MAYTLKQKAQLYHHLYTGSKAGLPLPVLLDPSVLPAGFRNAQVAGLQRLIEKGRPLSAALLFAKVITPWEMRLLAGGEASGRLETVLADLESFFMARHLQLAAIKAKLLYPLVVIVVATLVGPTPALASGQLLLADYVVDVAGKLALLAVLYQLLVVLPFEKATVGAFNPWLLKLVRRVDSDHWLRQVFEISWLNLLTTCLEAGVDAAESLRLLRDGTTDDGLRYQHILAINQIEKHGMSLAQALTVSGILCNHQIVSFLNTSERSGTLHSDLRQYVARRRGEMDALVKFKAGQYSKWLYVVMLLLAVSGYF